MDKKEILNSTDEFPKLFIRYRWYIAGNKDHHPIPLPNDPIPVAKPYHTHVHVFDGRGDKLVYGDDFYVEDNYVIMPADRLDQRYMVSFDYWVTSEKELRELVSSSPGHEN